MVLGPPLGFFASGVFGGIDAQLAELFATTLRGSRQGFCHNCGRGVVSVLPLLIGNSAEGMNLGQALCLSTTASKGLVILAVLFLPEAHGR
jgi:hypothetical protein